MMRTLKLLVAFSGLLWILPCFSTSVNVPGEGGFGNIVFADRTKLEGTFTVNGRNLTRCRNCKFSSLDDPSYWVEGNFWRQKKWDSMWQPDGLVTLRVRDDSMNIGFKGSIDLMSFYFRGSVQATDISSGISYQLPGNQSVEGLVAQLYEEATRVRSESLAEESRIEADRAANEKAKKEKADRLAKKKKQREKEKRKAEKKERLLADKTLYLAGIGTGFSVSADGHLISNNHVIYGCNEVKVHHDAKVIETDIMAKDPVNDLALLKADLKARKFLVLSRENPELLEEIYVAGFPLGRNISSSLKVTKGIVSALTGIGDNFSHIQIDAAVQSGNSGGPIINQKGNVVGVTVSKWADGNVENVAFGIKSNIVTNLLESKGVKLTSPTNKYLSNTVLGKRLANSTFLLSCWMTPARYASIQEEKKSQHEMAMRKVLFDELR